MWRRRLQIVIWMGFIPVFESSSIALRQHIRSSAKARKARQCTWRLPDKQVAMWWTLQRKSFETSQGFLQLLTLAGTYLAAKLSHVKAQSPTKEPRDPTSTSGLLLEPIRLS